MRNLGLKVILSLTIICAVLLAFPGTALAQTPEQDGQLVLGGSFHWKAVTAWMVTWQSSVELPRWKKIQ